MQGTNTIATIGTLIAILVMILIGILVYFEIAETEDAIEVTHGNTTGYDYTNFSITLEDPPDSSSELRVYWYNNSDNSWGNMPTGTNGSAFHNWTLGETKLWFNMTYNTTADAGNFVQCPGLDAINMTYNTTKGVVVRDNVNPRAVTVFELSPIIAIVIIAAILVGVVVGFGRKPGGV